MAKINIMNLQDNIYHCIGQLLAIGCMQGASGLHLFCKSTYNYIFKGTNASEMVPSISEIPDSNIRDVAQKVLAIIVVVTVVDVFLIKFFF